MLPDIRRAASLNKTFREALIKGLTADVAFVVVVSGVALSLGMPLNYALIMGILLATIMATVEIHKIKQAVELVLSWYPVRMDDTNNENTDTE